MGADARKLLSYPPNRICRPRNKLTVNLRQRQDIRLRSSYDGPPRVCYEMPRRRTAAITF
jgi:hypothetical protein